MSYRTTRSTTLINYYENDSGKIKLFTELDTGLAVDDFVYISGGDLDNQADLHLNAFDPYTDTIFFGYKVLSVDAALNTVTINANYVGGLTIGTETIISRSNFAYGEFFYGNFYDGVIGQTNNNICKVGADVIPSFYSSSISALPLNFIQGIIKKAVVTVGKIGDFTGALTSAYASNTIKLDYSTGFIVTTTIGINNDGLGYTKFINGTFGTNTYSSLFKFYNGSITGGTWTNGTFENGYLASKNYKVNWSNGIANNGIYENVIWAQGTANGGEFRNNTIFGTALSVDVVPDYLRIHMTKANITLFDSSDTIVLNNLEPAFTFSPAGSGYNQINFKESFLHIANVDSVYIDEPTTTYYVQIPIPSWLDYANLNLYNPFCDITFASINKGVIVASVNGGIISESANAFDDVRLYGNVTMALINKCVYNGGTISNSLIKDIYWNLGSLATSWVWNGRFNLINTSMSLINGGVIEGQGQYDFTTFKYVSHPNAVGIILSSGYFTMSVADSTVYWDNINYISGVFPTYGGGPVPYPGTLLTNTAVSETTWVYQAPASTLIPQPYAISFGNFNTNMYSNFAAILFNLYEYEKPVLNDAVAIKITNSGGITPLDTFYKFIDLTDAAQIDTANAALYNGSPVIGPVVNYPGTFKPATSFGASAKMKIYRAQPTINYPLSYTFTIVIRNLTTLVEFEYLSIYPAAMNITTTPPGQNFQILLKITALGGSVNSIPSDAAITTTFTTTKNGSPYTTSPYVPGFKMPNLYGPVAYSAPQLFPVKNMATGLAVTFPGNVITDEYVVSIAIDSKVNPLSGPAPVTINAKFLFV